MIQSMTGFGKAVSELPTRKITVEIKSLNSKQIDFSARIPAIYREKEMEIRNLVAKRVERGKVDFSIFIENTEREHTSHINTKVLTAYYQQIKEVSETLGVDTPSDWFQVLLRMPDCMKTETLEVVEPTEIATLVETIENALTQFEAFRAQEGEMLRKLFEQKIANIAQLLTEVEPFELERVEKIKCRINDALEKISAKDYDKNRFEQEMIYYIEKLDINEEKTRLTNHLNYFLETMESGHGQGKKLGFIVQEIGREVNTLGSKSNHAEMQKIVVRMKDELEQIKEQILNVM